MIKYATRKRKRIWNRFWTRERYGNGYGQPLSLLPMVPVDAKMVVDGDVRSDGPGGVSSAIL